MHNVAPLATGKKQEHFGALTKKTLWRKSATNPVVTNDDQPQRVLLPLARSEEVGLLHDAQEFLLIDLTIAIAIGLVNHLLKLFISHALTKLLGHTLEILEGDLARLIIVEET